MNRFEAIDHAAVARLIDDHPFAWIVADAAPDAATPMPLLLECDAAGMPVALIGHLPKVHRLVKAFAADPRGTFLFQGPHGYISPELLIDKDWAPTWNFASIIVVGKVTLDDALTERALTDLVAHMERDRTAPWTVAAMGDRYARLRDRVVGFRVAITSLRPRFKLGQDEEAGTFDQIVAGLGDTSLTRLMRSHR